MEFVKASSSAEPSVNQANASSGGVSSQHDIGSILFVSARRKTFEAHDIGRVNLLIEAFLGGDRAPSVVPTGLAVAGTTLGDAQALVQEAHLATLACQALCGASQSRSEAGASMHHPGIAPGSACSRTDASLAIRGGRKRSNTGDSAVFFAQASGAGMSSPGLAPEAAASVAGCAAQPGSRAPLSDGALSACQSREAAATWVPFTFQPQVPDIEPVHEAQVPFFKPQFPSVDTFLQSLFIPKEWMEFTRAAFVKGDDVRIGKWGPWSHGTTFEGFCSARYGRLGTSEQTTGGKVPPGGLYLAQLEDMAWQYPWAHSVWRPKREGGCCQGGEVMWIGGPPLMTKLVLEASYVRRIKRKKTHLAQFGPKNIKPLESSLGARRQR